MPPAPAASPGAASCYAHPGSPASQTCPGCLRPICEVCAVVDGLRVLCPACVRGARRGRRVRTALLTVLIVGALGGAGYALRGPIRELFKEKPKPPPTRTFNYGDLASTVRELDSQLAAEPCDRSKIIKLVETYYRAGDYRGVILRAEEFVKRCGKYPRVRWTTYEAHKQLSEWREAVADAAALIAEEPYDKDYRWWRGIALEQLGELEHAAEDYRQAIALVPNLRSIPINLADVLEKLGRPCEAILPLEQLLHHYPDTSDAEQLRDRVERLYGL